MAGSFDVITIGSATQDVFIRSRGWDEQKDPSAPDGFNACIPMGSKLPIDELTIATGGGATNAAVTFARFGLTTACFSVVGDDETGRTVINQLRDEGIDTGGIMIKSGEKTAYSVILVAGTGERGILTHRGAAGHLDAKSFPWTNTSWIYITSLAGDLQNNREVFAQAIELGARVAWNPGAKELELGMEKLAPLLRQTDILLLNREEAAELAQLPPRHLSEIISNIEYRVSKRDLILVVTDGANGAYVHANGETLYAPSLQGERKNTTGAGDAFGSAFVSAIAQNKNVKTALAWGMLNSFGVVTHMGAKAGILKKIPTDKDVKSIHISHADF
ncbi:carbohydrate kinase family protein [Candidatus Uhrbacteria bacterium]|nr:carbohydrate kinase family protein [Candidatus Uhrbacteria bacterium]